MRLMRDKRLGALHACAPPTAHIVLGERRLRAKPTTYERTFRVVSKLPLDFCNFYIKLFYFLVKC